MLFFVEFGLYTKYFVIKYLYSLMTQMRFHETYVYCHFMEVECYWRSLNSNAKIQKLKFISNH